MQNNQRTFCVTHEPPLVPQSLFHYAIGLGDYRPPVGWHISSVDPFWNRMRPRAYGAAGNYIIPKILDRMLPATDLTGINSHRKFIARTAIGTPAKSYAVYREVDAKIAHSIAPQESSPRDGQCFLVGSLVNIPHGVVHQYADKHCAIDLLDYLSIAVQMGVMDPDLVQGFFREIVFIPGGCELGVYPTPWLYDTLVKLERVGREFVTRFAERIDAYDRYQVRAVGFLAERLGSFLLLRELNRRYPAGIPREVFGQLCVIVSEGDTYRAATAAE